MAFSVRNSLVLVDTREDHAAACSINLDAWIYEDVIAGKFRVPPGRQILVVSHEEAHHRAADLVTRGFAMPDVRYLNLKGEFPLHVMVEKSRDRLRWLFEDPITVLGDRVKLLHQWPTPPMWTPWKTDDPAFDSFLRWRPRTLCVIAGDEGCGKSTFAQILALKLLRLPSFAS